MQTTGVAVPLVVAPSITYYHKGKGKPFHKRYLDDKDLWSREFALVVLSNNPDTRTGDRAVVEFSNGATDVWRFGEYYGHVTRER